MKRIIHTLSNGLRIVAEQSDGRVAYIGIVTDAGSRDDFPSAPGLAHFVEHTVFKGTERRKSWHINSRMESIGGELNAYTTKEETMIYTNAPAGYEGRAFELLADLVMNASFPQAEIDRERDVITEEIYSYRDNPMDAVYDEFDELIYKGNGLAHNILGTPESVRDIRREDARAYIDRYYTAPNMVIYCVAPSDPEKNIRLAEKYFGNLSTAAPERVRNVPEVIPAFRETRRLDNHQANTIVGMRLFGRRDPRRHALFLFNNYLGGPAMNSRLNQQLRERRGLVYTVDSSVTLYSDTGTLLVYYGSESGKVEKCERLIANEIATLAEKGLSERAFSQARDQYCGQSLVSGDHRENCAMSLAKSLLYYGEVHDVNYTADRMRTVSREQFREIAELIASAPLSRLTLA